MHMVQGPHCTVSISFDVIFVAMHKQVYIAINLVLVSYLGSFFLYTSY